MIEIDELEVIDEKIRKKQTFRYTINDKKVILHRIKLKISLHNPLDWCQSQTNFPKIFWQGPKKKKTSIGLGSILSFATPPTLFSNDQRQGPKFFGGIPFFESLLSKSKYSVWNSFNQTRFFLPEFEIEINNENAGYLYLNFLEGGCNETLKNRLKSLQIKTLLEDIKIQTPIKRIDIPSYGTWCETIEKSLYCFETTPLEKVVLARASYLSYPDTLLPFAILKKLTPFSHNATLFAFAPSSEGTFIGVSPERFYERKQRNITTEALAGTCKKGKNDKENIELKKNLKNSEKEGREFQYVQDFLNSKLSVICENFRPQKEKKIKETSTVYHLHTKFLGVLKKEICDAEIIKILHPTPAMGGNPQPLAIEFLDQTELFVRGNYAAPIGWISPKSSELIVAIRSAFIKNNCMTVFAGAGIVKGSNPLKEWEELEMKIAHFTKLGELCKTA